MKWNFKIRDRQFRIKRTLILASIGLISGFIMFFNSETFPGLVYRSIALAYLLGVIGFVSENLSPLKKLAVGIGLLTPVLIIWIVVAASAGICNLRADPGLEVKENGFTDEIKVKDTVSTCPDSLPWYYHRVSRSEAEQAIENHCSNTNSMACDLPEERRLEIAGYR
jgi:hypothetical protein